MKNSFDVSYFLSLQPICRGKFYYFDVLESTNDHAKHLVENGASSGTMVIAEQQTRGRGRGENVWQSAPGEGLLFSLVIDPDVAEVYWSRFAIVAAVALANVIGEKTQLKWPNDIYLGGKKCAGILSEIVGDKVVIGIGVNFFTEDFPNELNERATSLAKEGIDLSREQFLSEVVANFFQLGSLVYDGFETVVDQYRRYCSLSKKYIRFYAEGAVREGLVLGVDGMGALVVEQNGQQRVFAEGRRIEIVSPARGTS